MHCCLPSNSLRYFFFRHDFVRRRVFHLRGITPRSHTERLRTCLVVSGFASLPSSSSPSSSSFSSSLFPPSSLSSFYVCSSSFSSSASVTYSLPPSAPLFSTPSFSASPSLPHSLSSSPHSLSSSLFSSSSSVGFPPNSSFPHSLPLFSAASQSVTLLSSASSSPLSSTPLPSSSSSSPADVSLVADYYARILGLS